MPADLPCPGTDHHLGHVSRPGRLGHHRVERLQGHLVAAGHHPPRRVVAVGQVEAGAFINQPLAQLAFGCGAQHRGARRGRQTVKRNDPVGQRRGRHFGRNHVDLGDQPGFCCPGPGKRAQRSDPHQPLVRLEAAAAFDPAFDHALQRRDHSGARRIGQRQSRGAGHRQHIGGKLARPLHLRFGPIADQAIAIEIGRQGRRQCGPRRTIARDHDLGQPLLEAVVGVGDHVIAHAPQWRGERVAKIDSHITARQRALRRRNRRRGVADPQQARRPDLDRHRGNDLLRGGQAVAGLAVTAVRLDRPLEHPRRGRCIKAPAHLPRAACGELDAQRLDLGHCRFELRFGGDLHLLVRGVAQREHRVVAIAGAHDGGEARIERQVLRGTDLGLAGAEQLRAIGRDRDQLEARQRVRQRHRHPRLAIRVERDVALPQQHRLEIFAVDPRGIARPAASARGNRLLAVMALAHDLHLRGRRRNLEITLAHHRLQHIPTLVGHQREQRLVDRDEGHIGARRWLAVGLPDCNRDIRGIAHRILRPVGLHRNAELVAFPADLDLRQTDPVARLAEIDRRGRARRVLAEERQVEVPRHVGQPQTATLDPAAHRHDRDVDIGCIAPR